MQVVRDAIVLLVVVLIIATVRVSPVPEIELSPAQAAQTSRPAASVETPSRAAVPAHDPARVDPARGDRDGAGADDREKPTCPGAIAARPKVQPSPEDPAQAPCHV